MSTEEIMAAKAGDIPGHSLDPCPNPGNTSGYQRLSAVHEVFITATLLSSHIHYTNEWAWMCPSTILLGHCLLS